MAYFIAIVLLLVPFSDVKVKAESEPQCYSDFDFKTKLLTKVLEMEIIFRNQVTKFDEERKLLEDKLASFARKMEENDRVILELSSKVQEKMSELDKQSTRNTVAISEGFNQTATQLERKAESIEEYLNSSLRHVLDTVRRGAAVAFTAFGVQNKDIQVGEVMVYTTVIINVGDGYNSNNGVFTAPTTGVYLFMGQLANYGHTIVLEIVANGTTIQKGRSYLSNSHTTTTFSGVALLNRGEQASIRCYYLHKSGSNKAPILDDIYSRNSFTGGQHGVIGMLNFENAHRDISASLLMKVPYHYDLSFRPMYKAEISRCRNHRYNRCASESHIWQGFK